MWSPCGLAGVQEGKKNKCGQEILAGWLMRASLWVETGWGRSLRPCTELNGGHFEDYSLVLVRVQLDRGRNPKDSRDDDPTKFGDRL